MWNISQAKDALLFYLCDNVLHADVASVVWSYNPNRLQKPQLWFVRALKEDQNTSGVNTKTQKLGDRSPRLQCNTRLKTRQKLVPKTRRWLLKRFSSSSLNQNHQFTGLAIQWCNVVYTCSLSSSRENLGVATLNTVFRF